jgi:L-ribulose-5-phosphate 4-epimerase
MTQYAPIAPLQDTLGLREEIIDAARFWTEHDLTIGTWGNISVRVEEGLLITPSAMDYATLVPEDLVTVSWEGARIKGHRLASSETQTHRLLLLARPDMVASVHAHAPYACVCSAAHRTVPVVMEDMAQSLGAEVRCSIYVAGGRHLELAEAAVAALGKDSNAVLLANHGPFVLGATLKAAVVGIQVLEKAAMAFVLGGLIGGAVPIPHELVEEEHNRFVNKYGRPEDNSTG